MKILQQKYDEKTTFDLIDNGSVEGGVGGSQVLKVPGSNVYCFTWNFVFSLFFFLKLGSRYGHDA